MNIPDTHPISLVVFDMAGTTAEHPARRFSRGSSSGFGRVGRDHARIHRP